MEGGSVTVECAANSNPQPHKYTWLKRQKGLINKINSTERRKPFHNITRDTSLSCIAYNDIGTGKSDWLDLEVQFAPHILPTSDCTKSAAQINCSCKTAGNPSPTLQWYLDELPVNHSDKFAISYEPLNDTGFRSIIIVNQPQERAVSTVVCRSSNSLGSASQRYYVHSLSQSQDRVTLPVFITTVSALLVLVCALLFVIRAQKTGHNPSKSQCTGDTSAVTMSQLLTSGKGNEVPNTTEEDIYVNTNTLMQADVTFPTAVSEPNITDLSTSGTDNAEEAGKSSEKKNEKDTDTIYSIVKRKPKSKRSTENSVDMHQPGSSFLEE
ncbi:limbic system-associated membrane protein-like [Cottoperca gobio]|uniref:Limbic system-associated membrane protein-like n=1 Tax=Cottoperca gobio TaxID=56716 RepID=A0A6J2R9A2_COTGO|nr:limbic system-associated membrane protein-like [Cottoperca gobio]